MSVDPTATKPAATAPRARAAADVLRSVSAAQDLAMPDRDRLDDRTRNAALALFATMVGTVEHILGAAAAELARAPDAEALARTSARALPHLLRAGVLRDPALADELLGRVRQEHLAEALPRAVSDGERPSLLARLLSCPDTAVAGAARALLIADNRRRGVPIGTELPAELHHRLTWCVAAALRAEFDDSAALDHALTEAARRSFAAHDEGARAETAAVRLAAAIAASPAELPDLLIDALGDGNAILFIAALAQTGGLTYETARTFVLDPSGERLWLLLRAQDLRREAIARIAFALAEADPGRDIDAVADRLDEIAAITPTMAQAALAEWRLDPDFRAAVDMLAER